MNDPSPTSATNRTRILFVSPGISALGGAERSLQGLLERLDTDEFLPELLVFSEGSMAEWARERSIPVHALDVDLSKGGKRRGLAGSISWGITALPSLLNRRRQLTRLVATRGIDLVHTNGLQASAVATQAVSRLRVPVVMSIRDAPQRTLDKWVVRILTARSTIACNSAYVRHAYGFPASRSYVVDNPVTPPELRGREESRRRLGLPQDAFIVANASHVHPIKGHVHAIAAVANVPGCHLAIAAAPLYGAASRNYAEEIDHAIESAGQSVTLLGPLDDVSWLYGAADAVLHSSIAPEGFGRTIAEGMMAQRPIIASTCGAPGELLDDGRTALLYPPGDQPALEAHIIRLRDDRYLREHLVDEGSRWATRFEPARHAATMSAIYRRAVDAQSTNSPKVLILANGGKNSAAAERGQRIGEVLIGRGAETRLVHQTSGRRDLLLRGFRAAWWADIIYSVDLAVATTLPSLASRARLIVDTGDAPSLFLEHVSAPLWKRAAARLMEEFAYRRASALVVRGEGHLDVLPQSVRDRTTVIPDGVDLEIVQPVDSTDLRHRLDLDGLTVVGMSAHYTTHAALDMPLGLELVRAIDLCRDLPVGGLLIGDGAGLAHLTAEIDRLGLSDRVKAVGRVPYADLQRYLSVIDIAVLTQTDDPSSRVRTTGKLPVYLAMDRYILASRVGTAGRILPPDMLIDYDGRQDPTYPAKLADRIRARVRDGIPVELGTTRAMAEQFDYVRIAAKAADVILEVDAHERTRTR